MFIDGLNFNNIKNEEKEINKLYKNVIEEEKKYCDKGNYKHISQILTSIAIYQTLQKHGKSEEEAYRITSEEMWKALTPKTYRKMARLPFFLSAMKKILPFGFRHGSGIGWRYDWHLDEDPKDRFHFECRECVYYPKCGGGCRAAYSFKNKYDACFMDRYKTDFWINKIIGN